MKHFSSLLLVMCLAAGLSSGACSSSTSTPSKKQSAEASKPKEKEDKGSGDASSALDPRTGVPVENSEAAQIPISIDGGYMTGKITPSPTPGSITVGIIGMKGKIRLSDDTGRYTTTWTLDLETPVVQEVKIYKSKDPTYDQILEFVGTEEQLKAAVAAIKITLQYRENQDGVVSNNLVVSKLSDLIVGQ